MMRYWGYILIQFLIGFFSAIIVGTLGMIFLISQNPNLADLSQNLWFSLMLNFFWYYITFMLASRILHSADDRLIPFTPLTPLRLILRNMRNNAGFIFMFWICIPLAVWKFLGTPSRVSNLHSDLHLYGINMGLTFLLLALYPVLLGLTKHIWPWNIFFLARYVIGYFFFGLAVLPTKFLKRVGLSLIWYLMLLCVSIYYFHAALDQFSLLCQKLVETGWQGLMVLYLFLPMSGLYLMRTSTVPVFLQPLLTTFLLIMILACVVSIVNACRLRMVSLDVEKMNWWVENREQIEKDREEQVSETESENTNIQTQANALHEVFSESNQQTELTPELSKSEVTSIPAYASAESPTFDYNAEFSALDQIFRHQNFWHPIPRLCKLRLWFWLGICAWMINGLFCFLTYYGRISSRDADNGRILLVIVIPWVVLISQIIQGARLYQPLIDWSPLTRLRWPRSIFKGMIDLGFDVFAGDILLALLLSSIGGFFPSLFIGYLLLFVLSRVHIGLLYYCDARASAGRRTLKWIYVPLFLLIILIGDCAHSVLAVLPPVNRLELIVGLDIALLALLCVTLPFLALPHRMKDSQIVAQPGFNVFRIR